MRILLVEDEEKIVDFVKPGLEGEGFVVDAAKDGEQGIFLSKTNQYDLVILDNMLPIKNGDQVCQEIRQSGNPVPILVLSVLAEPDKKTALLNAGADDYLTKPFSFGELVARIRALLRRPHNVKNDILKFDNLVVDTVRHLMTRDGKRIHLTPKEFSLLEYFLRTPGTVVSRGMILEHVWDMNADPFSNTIESHILSLRKKVDAGFARKLIHTVHGIGYKIDLVP